MALKRHFSGNITNSDPAVVVVDEVGKTDVAAAGRR
jgi:hypothetical protein